MFPLLLLLISTKLNFYACVTVILLAFIANEEVLTEDDLMDIIDALKEGAFTTSDWYSLGLRLKIRNDDLKTIETDYNKVNRCLTECIVKWIKMGKATYTGLAGALEKMGEDAAANHIRTNNSE